MKRWLILLVLLVVIAVGGGIVVTRARVMAAPEQPIAFRHDLHNQAGVQCLYCHSGAMRSDIAGIPSVQKCMGCHTYVAADREVIQQLAGYWERREPIPWNRVNEQPDFVLFSHQPHILGGMNCETCHGDVGSMTVAHPVVRMDMGWCLDCHLDQPEEKVARLADCVICHK
jgi:hypothetical protein